MFNASVIWITGLPGAGKTTLAKALVKQLNIKRSDIIHLDGDSLREVFVNFDYSEAGRKKIAKQYAQLAGLLAAQDKIVVVSTVSLFHEIHDWNKQSLPNYIEVFVDASASLLKARNQKQLYSEAREDKDKIVGQGIKPQLPLSPTYHFKDAQLLDIDTCVSTIINADLLCSETI